MRPNPGPPHRSRRIIVPAILFGLAAVIVLGVGIWALLNSTSHKPSRNVVTPTATQSIGTEAPQPTPTPNTAVSPFIFGTNISLFDGNDQLLNSTAAQALLPQLHMRIIRMPTRNSLSQATLMQAARIIKDAGATPLVILQGGAVTPNALDYDTQVINNMNTIFGNSTVYYEYGNEEDLNGVSVGSYVASWNSIIPRLQSLAHNAQFVGPVNFQFDPNYLRTFLQQANPHPAAISWHEYTCDVNDDNNTCIANINHWTTHIATARAIMQQTIGSELPIMITEWNFASNASGNDSKSTDSTFITNWTTTALQTLAANRVFAAMQYAVTNSASPLINGNNAITAQGQAFQSAYQKMIVNGQPPTPVAGAASQPVAGATTTGQGGASAFSFEDGGTDGWNAHGPGIANLQNSTSVAYAGTHALKVSLSNADSNDYPYVSVGDPNLSAPPQPGQTITAYVYMASNSVTVRAKLFISDSSNQWHIGNVVNLQPGVWNRITFTVPQGISGQVNQLGIQFNSPATGGPGCDVYIDGVGWH
jgi:hypothetical protein